MNCCLIPLPYQNPLRQPTPRRHLPYETITKATNQAFVVGLIRPIFLPWFFASCLEWGYVI